MNRVAASQERAMGAMDIRAVAISLVRSSEGVISAGESMQHLATDALGLIGRKSGVIISIIPRSDSPAIGGIV